MTSPKVNYSIPATMSRRGLEYLARLAQSVPENGVIVEVGPLFGSSTWVLSKNAPSSARIFSIDTWEPQPWIDKVERKYRNCKPFSKEAFLYYTRDCHNVTAIQGWSPDIVSDWHEPIDLFFDDATHGDPGFSANVNFFLPFVNDNAILCGDDYSKGWPDIVKVVDKLAHRWDSETEVIGRVWSLRKPVDGANPSKPVNLSYDKSRSTPVFEVITESVSGRQYRLPPEVWSGATHKKDRLEKLHLSLTGHADQLSFTCSLTLNTGRVITLDMSNSQLECKDKEWLTGIKIDLKGAAAEKLTCEYEISYCFFDGSGRRYNTVQGKNGSWAKTLGPKHAITSVRICIATNAQRAHEKAEWTKSILLYTSFGNVKKVILDKLRSFWNRRMGNVSK